MFLRMEQQLENMVASGTGSVGGLQRKPTVSERIFNLQNQSEKVDINTFVKNQSMKIFKRTQEGKKKQRKSQSPKANFSPERLKDLRHQIYTRRLFEKNVEL